MGIGLGLGIKDLTLLRKSLSNFLFAVGVGLATSTLYFLISPINEAQSELLARTSPNIYDVLIAFFGGLAGILAASSRHKGNVIPGVAIATALMPPLCTAGFGLATLNASYFFGAFYLFFINTVFIAWATYITVKLLRFPQKSFMNAKAEMRADRLVNAIVILTMIPSVYFAYIFRQDMDFEIKAKKFVSSGTSLEGNYLLQSDFKASGRSIKLVYGGRGLTAEQNDSLMSRLNDFDLAGCKLEVKQGLSVIERKRIESQLGEIRSALDKKDLIINELSLKLDSAKYLESLSSQLTSEARINFPGLKSIEVSRSSSHKDSLGNKPYRLYVSTEKVFRPADKVKLGEWIAVRLGDTAVKVAFTD